MAYQAGRGRLAAEEKFATSIRVGTFRQSQNGIDRRRFERSHGHLDSQLTIQLKQPSEEP